jgi:hypothetical protein
MCHTPTAAAQTAIATSGLPSQPRRACKGRFPSTNRTAKRGEHECEQRPANRNEQQRRPGIADQDVLEHVKQAEAVERIRDAEPPPTMRSCFERPERREG